MNRLIIVGSPRVDGRSAHLADMLFETCIEECPQDELALAPVSTLDIFPCQGCDACRSLMEGVASDGTDDEADGEGQVVSQRCVIQDDMAEVYELIENADELIVVSPVYFAGPPSQLTALLDRLQPYFWTDARKAPKRPATLHVVGEGGDPHGFEPLIGIVRSALSCAGFSLNRVLDWVGKIDGDGEILAEAVEYPLPPLPGVTKEGMTREEPNGDEDEWVDSREQVESPSNIVRPKFTLSQESAKPKQSSKIESPVQKGNNPARKSNGSARKGGNTAHKGNSSANRGGKRRG
ncbi:MAG: NAD(P)H-dependent oxidoreductase [Gordonibacter sp.]|nr:NAD(P)H-dependent oxidoreductase [Gordonibacter sp.]